VPQVQAQPGMQAKHPPISAGQVTTAGPSVVGLASDGAHWWWQVPLQQVRSLGQRPPTSQAIPSFQDRFKHETAAIPIANTPTTRITRITRITMASQDLDLARTGSRATVPST
jgi:hypothetical protein